MLFLPMRGYEMPGSMDDESRLHLLFLPMRGYEKAIHYSALSQFKLFLPMRGYEREGSGARWYSIMLFLPMRGYEGTPAIIVSIVSFVISPHEGL